MMKPLIRLTASIFLAVMPLQSMAASSSGDFALKGYGQQSCSDFLAARETANTEYLRFGSWMLGYLSGYNQFVEDTLDIAPWQSADFLAAVVANICRADPDLTFFAAINQMTTALAPQRITSDPGRQQIGTGETRAELYSTMIRRLQVQLTERGFFIGEANGEYNSITEAAVRAFQASEEIDETGLPNEQTLYLLFR